MDSSMCLKMVIQKPHILSKNSPIVLNAKAQSSVWNISQVYSVKLELKAGVAV